MLIGYALAGMNAFEAFNHTMTTVSTGGFSTEAISLAAFDSLAIELVAIFGMVLAGINFAFYWRTIRGKQMMPQSAEVRVYLLILAFATVAVADQRADRRRRRRFRLEALRDSAFSVVTVMTGTGFTTVDFDNWNDFARVAILLLMFGGACAGSTTGGLKVIRMMLLVKTAQQEVSGSCSRLRSRCCRSAAAPSPRTCAASVLGFFLLYVLVYVAGSLAMGATGVDPITAISAAATTINIVGPGLGEIGATDDFTAIPEAGRMVGALLMLTGRLEIFTVVALLAAVFQLHRRVLRQPSRSGCVQGRRTAT